MIKVLLSVAAENKGVILAQPDRLKFINGEVFEPDKPNLEQAKTKQGILIKFLHWLQGGGVVVPNYIIGRKAHFETVYYCII